MKHNKQKYTHRHMLLTLSYNGGEMKWSLVCQCRCLHGSSAICNVNCAEINTFEHVNKE